MFRSKNKAEKRKMNKYIANSLGKCLIYDFVFIFILVLSMIFQKRMLTFSDIFGSLFGLKNVGIYIYYGCLGIGVLFYTAMILRTILLDDSKKLFNVLNDVERYGDIPIFIVRCVTVILFVMIFITTPCTVVGNSMNDTFQNGDKVMCFNLVGKYNRGDVIVFSAEHYMDDESFYIKRVVAKEGDHVEYDIHTQVFTVNEEAEEGVGALDYNRIADSLGIDRNTFDFYVPKGKLLVFGDNRSFGGSIDSRFFGAIDTKDVFGRVYLRIFPFNKIGVF